MSQYCTECGAELSGTVEVCDNCGAEVRSGEFDWLASPGGPEPDGQGTVGHADVGDDSWQRYLPESWRIGVIGVVLGMIVGGVVFLALTNVGSTATGFMIAFLVVTVYLWQQPSTIDSIVAGLYILAIAVMLVPLVYYGPLIGVRTDPQTAEEFSMIAGRIYSLLVWTIILAPIAGVIGAVGYYIRQRYTDISDGYS